MKLFNRQNQQPDVPPELQPYYGTSQNSAVRRWLAWGLRMVILVAIIVLIVLGVRWGWHKLHKQTSTTTPSNQSQVNQPPSKDNIPKTSGAPAQTPSSDTTNNTAVPPPSGSLPNTGG